MTDLSNEELLRKIKEYQELLDKRINNKSTVNIDKIVDSNKINIKNVTMLLQNKEMIKDVVVTHWYYNNLSIEKIVTPVDKNLYLLYEKLWRIQCKSDSSYDEDEASEDSDGEISVTKIKNICYMTQTDLDLFLNHLLQKNNK